MCHFRRTGTFLPNLVTFRAVFKQQTVRKTPIIIIINASWLYNFYQPNNLSAFLDRICSEVNLWTRSFHLEDTCIFKTKTQVTVFWCNIQHKQTNKKKKKKLTQLATHRMHSFVFFFLEFEAIFFRIWGMRSIFKYEFLMQWKLFRTKEFIYFILKHAISHTTYSNR